MRSRSFLACLLLILLGWSLTALADIRFLWLDRPKGRSNGNDPKSETYVPPFLRTPTASPVVTATVTATPCVPPVQSAPSNAAPVPVKGAQP